MGATDPAGRAFRVALAAGMAGVAGLVAVAALLSPVGAIAHLYGFVTRMCVTLTHVTSDVAALLLVLVVGASAIAGCVTVAAGVVLHRRMQRTWLPVDDAASRRAQRVARAISLRCRVVVFEHGEPIACSRGMLRPTTWLSTAAVDALDDDPQLAAVLVHEEHHCGRRDPLRSAVLGVLERTLFAFPVVAACAREFRRRAEFAADDAARDVAGRGAIAGALLRFAEQPRRATGALGVVGFGSGTATVGERVARLLGAADRGAPTSLQRALRTSMASAAVVLVALATVSVLPGM